MRLKIFKCRMWWTLAYVSFLPALIVNDPYYALMLVARWIVPKLRAHADKSDAENKAVRAYLYIFPRHHFPGLVVAFSMLAVFLGLNFYQAVIGFLLALPFVAVYLMIVEKILYFIVQMAISQGFRSDVWANRKGRTVTYLKPSNLSSIVGYGLLVVSIGIILSLYPNEILSIYPHATTFMYISGLVVLLMNVMVSLHMIGIEKSYKNEPKINPRVIYKSSIFSPERDAYLDQLLKDFQSPSAN